MLAVDPGREKCGVAVCGPSEVLARDVVTLADLRSTAGRLARLYGVHAVIVGDQTNGKHVCALLESLAIPVTSVHERGSTLRARRRYFQDHPPRGWRRFWPRSLQVPPEPYDDYAAVVLGEDFLARARTAASASPTEVSGRDPGGVAES